MPARKEKNATVVYFAELLRSARNARCYKQSFCAGACKVSLRQYKRLETGRCFPSPKTRKEVRKLFPDIFPTMLKKKDNEQAMRLLRQR